MKTKFDQSYWEKRYQSGQVGWDIGKVSTPLKEYIDQLTQKEMSILIPGAGNGYEAGYLWKQGFENTHILDISKTALDNFNSAFPYFYYKNIHLGDFWAHQGKYDVILEQTFFCAIDIHLRKSYVEKIHDLLVPNGKVIGLLWSEEMGGDAPPFGGSIGEYRELFEDLFSIEIMEETHNSIATRAGRELFIKLIKK